MPVSIAARESQGQSSGRREEENQVAVELDALVRDESAACRVMALNRPSHAVKGEGECDREEGAGRAEEAEASASDLPKPRKPLRNDCEIPASPPASAGRESKERRRAKEDALADERLPRLDKVQERRETCRALRRPVVLACASPGLSVGLAASRARGKRNEPMRKFLRAALARGSSLEMISVLRGYCRKQERVSRSG